MNDGLIESQGLLRMGLFFGVLAMLLWLERRFPRRPGDMRRRLRWPPNFGLAVLDAALLWALPFAVLGTAFWAERHGWGLLYQVALPAWAAILAAWVALDMAVYWQHRLLHEIRWLWPLHRVHHTDVEFDTTTGVRFHPAEILLSTMWKCAVVLALGAPPLAVLLMEISLSGFSLFTHANLHLPARFERILRFALVTPEMHRVHHSPYRAETDSNYGTVLSAWDRLFRSYTAQPRDGHTSMRIGLTECRADADQRLAALLRQPFVR